MPFILHSRFANNEWNFKQLDSNDLRPISRFPINFRLARDPGGIDYFLKADL